MADDVFGNEKMMIVRYTLCLAVLLAMPAANAQVSCENNDMALDNLSSSVAMGLIEEHARAGDFSCAAGMTRARARALATVNGADGVNARFALRELALAIAEDKALSSSGRLQLAREAAGTFNDPENARKDDVQADVRFLFSVSKRFKDQADLGTWLDTLQLAIRLDQRLPESDRRLQSGEGSTGLFSEAGGRKEYARLAQLAALTRGDKTLARLRSQLAYAASFNADPWNQQARRDQVLTHCSDLLQLVDLLDDVTSCYACVKEWRWKPIMNVGVAYHRLGMVTEAKTTIERALAIVRGIENPESRLGQFRFAFTDLLTSRYDRATVLAVAGEMKILYQSSNTTLAKELRESLPGTMKRWGFNDFQ
jgi:tetratricopeptide (TPR) repeat protein